MQNYLLYLLSILCFAYLLVISQCQPQVLANEMKFSKNFKSYILKNQKNKKISQIESKQPVSLLKNLQMHIDSKRRLLDAQNSLQQTTSIACNTSNTTNNCCGDNKTQVQDQQCDDGNTISGDGCTQNCRIQYCGDGLINNNIIINNSSQQCDDGNAQNGDGCSALCQLQCGNGLIDQNQECDDGNTVDGDGCNHVCIRQTKSSVLALAIGIPLIFVAAIGILIVAKMDFGATAADSASAAGDLQNKQQDLKDNGNASINEIHRQVIKDQYFNQITIKF